MPKTITANGKTLNFASVDWKKTNLETIDYDQLADKYTATVTYTATGTKSSVKGYVTTAEYKGMVSKELNGKTVYTAYFIGEKIEFEPTIIEKAREMTKEEMISKLSEMKQEEKLNKVGIQFNPVLISLIILFLAIVGFLMYLMLLRGNVIVHSMVDDTFGKVSRTRIIVKNKNYIIDLTSFTSEVTMPTFLLLVNRFTARMLDGKTVNINYGSKNFQHKIEITEHNRGKKYQFEVGF